MKNLLSSIVFALMVDSAFAQDPTVSYMEELNKNTELQGLYKKIPLDVSKGQSLDIFSNNQLLLLIGDLK